MFEDGLWFFHCFNTITNLDIVTLDEIIRIIIPLTHSMTDQPNTIKP